MTSYVGAIDQGTTSTRFIIYNHRGEAVGQAQKEHRQIYPQPGWVEHDPLEIWCNTEDVIRSALEQACINGSELAAVGITNQRETPSCGTDIPAPPIAMPSSGSVPGPPTSATT